MLVPHHSSKILIYNPKSNKIEKECPHEETGWSACCGGVLLPSGDVVLIPQDALNILIYSPSQNKIVKRVQKGQGSFRGGVLLPDGTVLLVPGVGAEGIAIFSPSQGEIIRRCELPELNKKMSFTGAVLLPSGNVYLAPFGENTKVYIYDYRKNKIVQKIQTHGSCFFGGGLTPTGEVLSVSLGETDALLSDKKTIVQIHAGWCKGGCVTLPTGNVLAVPYYAGFTDFISPSQKKKIQTGNVKSWNEGYIGGVLLPNGDVVLVPFKEPCIKVYRPDYAKPIFFPKEACESPYLNKL